MALPLSASTLLRDVTFVCYVVTVTGQVTLSRVNVRAAACYSVCARLCMFARVTVCHPVCLLTSRHPRPYPALPPVGVVVASPACAQRRLCRRCDLVPEHGLSYFTENASPCVVVTDALLGRACFVIA